MGSIFNSKEIGEMMNKILIFEDDKTLNEIYKHLFKGKYDLYQYIKPSEFKYLNCPETKLIITDGHMENETCYDTLKILKYHYNNQVPLILCSGDLELIRDFSTKGYHTMMKPMNMKKLTDIINQHLKHI